MVDNEIMKGETTQQILDVAQHLVRTKGYSGFSYADISEQVGIRKASIHYHFPCKEDLARELVRRYRETIRLQLHQIEQSQADPQEQLVRFCRLYRNGLSQDQLCLCGMMSADLALLPETVQEEVNAFFTETEAWLTRLLQQGAETGSFRLRITPASEAALLLATLQGTQLIARAATDSEATFDRIIDALLTATCHPR